MTKKISALSILFFMFFVNSLLANYNDYKNYKISIRPFNFDPNYDTYIQEIIESVLTGNGLNIFNRDKNLDKKIEKENNNTKNNNQNIQRTAITHVVSGNIMKLENRYICSISIKNINTYEPEKSVTKVLNDLSYDNIVKLSLDLYEKITGQKANSILETHQVNNNNYNYIQKPKPITRISRIPAMVTGIIFFASGFAGTIYSGMELTSWFSEVGGAAANEYYIYNNPNSIINYGIEYTKKDLYYAWKDGKINTKPDDMPKLTPLGSGIMLGSSIALTIIGLGLFGWSLSDQPYFASNFHITPSLFDSYGRFNMGFEMAFNLELKTM